MAVDKLVDSAQLDADLTSVANAIRTKGGTSAQLAFPSGFVSAIGAISGSSVYMAQYTLTGDTPWVDFLNNCAYQVHSTTCFIMLRASGTGVPSIGNYTLNNFIWGFNGGTIVNGTHCYQSGKKSANSFAAFPRFADESNTSATIENGVLKSTHTTGTNCLGTTGTVVTLVEVVLPDDFWSVLNGSPIS